MSAVAELLRTPYKGLAAFEDSELDALLFFGRERETEIVVSNLLAAKLTVLYGPSGVGKSSLLRAAVARRLRELAPDADVLVLDEWLEEPELPEPDGEAFLVLDQFEEYFLYHGEGVLAEALPALLARPRTHVLIALREDQLARLDAFQARIPNVFANRLRLGHLDESSARAAIVGPLDRWNEAADESERVGIETALVDAVLEQVATTPGRIEAPYLQLVLERVWDEERAAGSRVLRLETLERLGGAEAVVGAHLEDALGALPPREAEVATNALRFLVTPSRMKIAQTLGDLAGYTNESPVVLRAVLERLAAQRVLRAVSADGDARYEIYHDVLAEPVLAWRREREARAALAAAARRHRRLAIVAGTSLALAAAMVALAVYAFAQRSEATRQRRDALAAKAVAEQRQQEATLARAAAIAARRRAQHNAEVAQANAAEAQKNQQQAEANAEQAQASEQQAKESQAQAEQSAQQAQASEQKAKESRARAVANAREAQRSRAAALRAKKSAQHQALVARIGRLVALAQANLDTHPVTSVQSAVAASRLSVGPAVEDALRASLLHMRLRAILPGGGGDVSSAVFSPDGTLVATGALGDSVRIWSASTHRLLHRFDAGSPVEVVAFDPTSKLLVAGNARSAIVLDARTGAVVRRLPHDGRVLDVAFAGGGRDLVTASADGSVRIWDTATGELLHQLAGGTPAQVQLAVSPDGTMVAARGQGSPTARIWTVADGTPLGAVSQTAELTGMAFSPDGRYFVTTGRRNGFVWDPHTWQLERQLVGHSAAITDVAFQPDGHVVTSSIDSSARVWDPATGDTVFTLLRHQQKINAVAASPDGQKIATASSDDTALLWTAPLGTTPIVLGGHDDAVTEASFSPDSSLLLTASADGTARLWDTQTPTLSRVGAQGGPITGVHWSPDGKLMLSGGSDGTARLWRGPEATVLQHGGKTVRAIFSADGSRVLTAGDDGTAKLWRSSDGALLQTFAHGAPVHAALFANHGVVTAGDDGVLKAWTLSGRPVWSTATGAPITAAAAADGTIATGAPDGTIRTWRGDDGKALRTLHGHTASVTSLAFDRSGSLLISGGSDAAAFIWNVATGEPRARLLGHTFAITSVSFSPDGTLALTASVDGDARLWDVKTGKPVTRLNFHVSTVAQASFSPNGKWVVTAGPTTAGIWQVRTGRLLYSLRGAQGNLTSAEWAPDSRRIVTGDTGGTVNTYECGVCVDTAALRAQALARLAALR